MDRKTTAGCGHLLAFIREYVETRGGLAVLSEAEKKSLSRMFLDGSSSPPQTSLPLVGTAGPIVMRYPLHPAGKKHGVPLARGEGFVADRKQIIKMRLPAKQTGTASFSHDGNGMAEYHMKQGNKNMMLARGRMKWIANGGAFLVPHGPATENLYGSPPGKKSTIRFDVL